MRLLFLAILAAPNLAFAQGFVADTQTNCKLALKGSGPPSPTMSVSWDGPCVKGYMHGRSVLRHFSNGKPSGVYEGDLVAGWATGRGVWTSEGYRYEGGWRRGDRHGHGVATFSDGSRYAGGWLNDRRNGRGVTTFNSGARFEGNYRNDLPNGFGTYTLADGRAFSGNWTNGCFRQGDRWAIVGATKEKCGFK